MKAWKPALLLAALAAVVMISACSDDDDGGVTGTPDPKEWHGTWLSAGDNVAPILVAVFNYDSVRVHMRDDNTVSLETHVIDGAWTTTDGVYTVTETSKSDVLAIELVYPAFSQEGIIQVVAGAPDILKLEAVQTLPDIGAVPRTPATGFGSDPTLGTSNIQIYELESEAVAREWHGEWLSAGDNVAPLLVSLFDYDSVLVHMDIDNTVTLQTHVAGGAWTTTEGTYVVTETGKSGVLAIELIYPAFSQEGIIQVVQGAPDVLSLEVVQTTPDIGAVPRTPETGFGSDASLGDLNIQKYVPVDETVDREWFGEWLSVGDDVAPILVSLFDYDSVRVHMDPDNTVTLETHVFEGAWTTTEGVYSIDETDKTGVLSIQLIYPAFSQEGIIQVEQGMLGAADILSLEVVQTEPDIGAVPRTPESGFGSDATLGDLNIQTYRKQ